VIVLNFSQALNVKLIKYILKNQTIFLRSFRLYLIRLKCDIKLYKNAPCLLVQVFMTKNISLWDYMKTKKDLLNIFSELAILTKTYEHEPLFTVEQALTVASHIPGAWCKNLFLKDSKNNVYLISAVHDTKIELKKMSKFIKAPELRFASSELLKQYLNVEPGSVTPFGLINDIDISFHPLENTATTVIKSADLITFIKYCGNSFQVIDFSQI